MNATARLVFGGFAFLTLFMVALIFLPAGTWNYWQAWVYLVIFLGASIWLTAYLWRHDPALLARRSTGGPTAEKDPEQRRIQAFNAVFFLSLIVVPALDHRWGWSHVPLALVVSGDVLAIVGFAILYQVYRQNTFASATVEVSEGQRVISTGLYGLVRHPMYSGGLILIFATPIALGSWWGLISALLLVVGITWRIAAEERLLVAELPGYAAYRQTVRFRLIPRIW